MTTATKAQRAASDRAIGRRRDRRTTLIVVAALVVTAAAVLLTASVVLPAQARFSGSTTNEGSLFAAAAIDLRLGADGTGTDSALLVDVVDLVPGIVLERCIVATYAGSVDDVTIWLAGERSGAESLDEYLLAAIDVGAGADPECTDFVAGGRVYDGSLAGLWSDGDTPPIELLRGAADGEAVTIRFLLTLVDDDDAQGLETRFWFRIGARP